MRPSRQQIEERLILRAWESKAFRRELLKNPKAAVSRTLSEMTGKRTGLPKDLQIKVHEESERLIHIVLPAPSYDYDSEASPLILPWQRSFEPGE